MSRIVIAALYQFADFADYQQRREPLLNFCNQHSIKGTLLIAHEGINGTIAGERDGIDAVVRYLTSELGFNRLEYKESFSDTCPFLRMKVKLKKEIVTLGVPGVNPNKLKGEYVDAQQWNALISDPDVIVIDTRNNYEYAVGTFENAANPMTNNFREFPDYVQTHLNQADNKLKKVAMFCTGGIRCEKATAYMREQGFEQVYHLKGGILKYLEDVAPEESLWQGECFVFDERVTVNHELEKGDYDQCYGCRMPITDLEKQSPKYVKGVSCPHCFDAMSDEKRRSNEERQRQIELGRSRNQPHLGQSFDRHTVDHLKKSAAEL